MDEPTAALTSHEVERLFDIIRDLQAHGIGVIYISHRLDEIFTIADRVLVLRDGRMSASGQSTEFTRGELIEMMVGRELKDEFPKRSRDRSARSGWLSPACAGPGRAGRVVLRPRAARSWR